ncbi:1-(5-phosphoribosyl)-5-[(5-phosphoribosylamino)methylideneamino]imidazole-4-carboxamide isomerase [Brevundimonas intermedia]|uniref:1-(5-phosphoribosyl)-5-[(5- phosphoribosylamino)methylideneamino]imidazole-4- carboxamide isomerase n=1 Tax=Brevundimonas intermedia TaxID=74315 RepID=UPI0032085186
MLIYPAIDLKDGVCVRLMHGKFDQVTQYDEQPAARLTAFATEGAQWIHIVDLDGAEAGEARQHGLIGELTQAIDVKIQSGGGVRGANDVAKLLDAGVSRVVVGSLAVTQPNDVAAWLKGFGVERITLALDVKIENGVPVPALKGWTQSSGVTLWEALDRYPKGTAKHLLVTDVGRDGAMTGPNLDLLAEIRQRRPDLVLQASGGVSSLDDIAAVKALGCHGVIVGRALYEDRFTLPEAIATAKRS